MKLRGTTVRGLLAKRALSVSVLALRTGIDADRLATALDDQAELGADEIAELAEELAVPVPALFMREPMLTVAAVDFRSALPSVRKQGKSTLETFQFIERVSATLAEIDAGVPKTQIEFHTGGLATTDATELARTWRRRWGISIDDQLGFQDPNKLYVSLRAFIESLGIFVVHRRLDSPDIAGLYAKVDNGPHIVAINTNGSSKARKCFTLAHEFCHVLLKRTGISDPSVLKNSIEKFCNAFAARLLAPRLLVDRAVREYGRTASINNDYIRLLARRIGISQEATVRRLVECGHLLKGSYETWRAQFGGRVPVGDTTDGSGGKSDPLQNKRTQFGSLLIRVLGRAVRDGDLDEIDVYRLCGLKPKYQRPLFEAA